MKSISRTNPASPSKDAWHRIYRWVGSVFGLQDLNRGLAPLRHDQGNPRALGGSPTTGHTQKVLVELNELIDQALLALTPLGEKVDLRLALDEEQLWIKTEAREFSKVIYYLLSHTLQESDKVNTHQLGNRYLEIRTGQHRGNQQDWVYLEISNDEGSISEKELWEMRHADSWTADDIGACDLLRAQQTLKSLGGSLTCAFLDEKTGSGRRLLMVMPLATSLRGA